MIPFIVLSMTAMKISAENPEDRERQKQLRKELNPKWLVALSPFAYLNDTIEIAKLYANTDLDIKRSVAICPLCNMAYEAVVRNRVKKIDNETFRLIILAYSCACVRNLITTLVMARP